MYETSKINPICFSFSFGRFSNKIWLSIGVSIHSCNVFHTMASQWRHMTIWFLAMACHHDIPQSKALSDMLFLHCLACNVQYVKKHFCPFHTTHYQIPFCCIVFFHKLLNIAYKYSRIHFIFRLATGTE